jgi:hypothetical protein
MGVGHISAVDRAIARMRRRRGVGPDSERERLVGLGSVILGRLGADAELVSDEGFRLYSGLQEGGDLLIYYREYSIWENRSFYVTSDAQLFFSTSNVGSDGLVVTRIDLASPEDFLEIDPAMVEGLYEDLMKEGFWDRVAFKHIHRGKPGYEGVWREKQ